MFPLHQHMAFTSFLFRDIKNLNWCQDLKKFYARHHGLVDPYNVLLKVLMLHIGDSMPHVMGCVLKSKINYRNSPNVFRILVQSE